MIAHLLNVSAEVWRLNSTSDGAGGWTEAHVLSHTEQVRISPAGATEQMVAAQQSLTLTHAAYTEATSTLRRGDQLRAGGRIYEVLGGRTPSRPHHAKWWLEEEQVSTPT